MAPAVLLALGAVVTAAGARPLSAGTERVSTASDGAQANDISGRFGGPAIGGKGLLVAFDSLATNLVAGDTNGAADVFVKNRRTGETTRVSVRSDGREVRADSQRPAVAAAAPVVAFDSSSPNYVQRDNNSVLDVFVHDQRSGQTVLASITPDGRAGNGASFSPSISANGRYVAFVSDASDLVAGDRNNTRDVFVRDLKLGVTTLVNLSSDDQQDDRGAAPPAISADGRYVAFGSFGDNLVPDDTNDAFDIFVRDLRRETTTRVSVATDGTQGDAESFEQTISAHGEVVAFASDATTLVPDDTNGARDAFVHVMATGVTERVSIADDEAQANGQSVGPGIRGGTTSAPSISADGNRVAFDSIATNLVPGDTNLCPPFFDDPDHPGVCPDVFVRDRAAGTTTRVSLASDGSEGDGASTDPVIDSTGTVVAWFSAASNLVPGDTNNCRPFHTTGTCPDIFTHGVG